MNTTTAQTPAQVKNNAKEAATPCPVHNKPLAECAHGTRHR